MLFSDQEKKILDLTFKGSSCSEIADTMKISVNSVKSYKYRIKHKLRKFGVNEIIDLAKLPIFI